MKGLRTDLSPDLLSQTRQTNKDRAHERAIELRATGLSFTEIAARLGNIYWPAEIGRWCQAHEEYKATEVRALPNSTVLGLFGPKGSGKSLVACALAWEYYTAGIPVFFNPQGLLMFPPSEHGYCGFASLRDIIFRADRLRNCLIVLDELQVNLSKYRSGATASVLIRGVIQQVRKLGIDMIVTSNSPSQIDGAFAEQLDFHGMCSGHLPPEDPRDYINIMWVDTQSHYGHGSSRMWRGRQTDQRLRGGEILQYASSYYSLYDTHVQVNPLEVMGITAAVIGGEQEEREVGLSVEDLRIFLRDTVIPDFVINLEATSVVPALAADLMATRYARGYSHLSCCGTVSTTETSDTGCKKGERLPLVISPELLGRALKASGLEKRGRSQAWVLPDRDNLDKWAAGLCSADE